MTSQSRRLVWMENFRQALITLLSHKFRSFLTVLGVMVGVITVVLVASILTGLRGQLVGMIEDFGTTNIYAFHLNTGVQIGRRTRAEMERDPLQLENIRAIKTRCDAVKDVGYQIVFPRHLQNRSVKYMGEEYYQGQIEAISPNLHFLVNHRLTEGRLLTTIDDHHRLFNCVIGHAVAEALFPFMNPLGKEITVAGKRFTVVGVLAKSRSTFLGNSGEDQAIYIPYQTLLKMSPREDWLMIVVRAKSGMLEQALDQVEQTLRMERKLKADDENDFSMSTAESIVRQFDQITAGAGMITIAISAVGLLVGGIGVMNIMLVSVKERTREIGVRKAIGARRRDITAQFLIEAMTLTGMGGVIGIALSLLIGLLITLLLPDMPATAPLWAIIGAFTISVMVGLLFGVWPATRAAKLDPIDCLHYE
ncbi:MAG: ABC transporter permease [Acidobacteria bacterium]|nr:ABC transporter permease [Acidobacteriota bacterium]